MDYNAIRRKTREIKVGNVRIGGLSPISIQSMTNTDTHDIEATYRQTVLLADAGCDIVRITAPDTEAAKTFSELKKRGVRVPLVADIHFDYKIAIAAAKAGVDKIRINPGNIGSKEKTAEVVRACKEYGIPIRIGVNSGSVEKGLLEKHGGPTPKALTESAINHARILEELDFQDIVISIKASCVSDMIEANRMLAEKTEYPLHLGVTEAGARERAIIKSSVGIGSLLSAGIGDTVRVSLTENPEREIEVAKGILSSLGLVRDSGIDIVSCPTCGRTKINLIELLDRLEKRIKAEGLDRKNIKLAVMGCAVNGPGEAREADIGIAGGVGEGLIFKKGVIVKKVKEDKLIDALIEEIRSL